jgi:hypothetical protein
MSTMIDRALTTARIDFHPTSRQPLLSRVVVATVVAIGGSLLADALLVAIGTLVFPATKGYVHFHFADYAKLTIVGVMVAGAAWPIVTRLTSGPRWLFTRLAILVTVVLLTPDVWLLVKGQPPHAIAVLVVMHLAIALVTYNTLVHIAALRPLVVLHRSTSPGHRSMA